MLGPLLEVEMSKKCTLLWREAHFEVNMYKTHHFWKLRCRKSAHCCGAKHISMSKCVQNTPCSDHLWKLRCQKSARRCSGKHSSRVKTCKTNYMFGPLLDVQMSKKCTLWQARSTLCDLVKSVAKRTGFCGISKIDGELGAFEEDLQRWISMYFAVAGAVEETCSSEMLGPLGGQARWFPERLCTFGASDLQVCWDDFAWQVQHFVWRLQITFSWYEAVQSAACSDFPFLKEVSQMSKKFLAHCCACKGAALFVSQNVHTLVSGYAFTISYGCCDVENSARWWGGAITSHVRLCPYVWCSHTHATLPLMEVVGGRITCTLLPRYVLTCDVHTRATLIMGGGGGQ